MNLLPGLTYHHRPEKLIGKLAFLLRHDSTRTNSETSASIYEFDLSQKSLRKTTESPKGLFIPSDAGNVFCVVYSPNVSIPYNDRKVFVYADSLQSSRSLTLESHIRKTVIVDGHVYFEVGKENNTKMFDHDIVRDQTRLVEFPDADKCEFQRYGWIHAPTGQNDTLHFYYECSGKRFTEGKDYRDGYYSLNTRTGAIQWHAELLDDEDDDRYTFKTFDGNYIFFSGRNAPIIGVKLASSPRRHNRTNEQASKGERVKVLHIFSKLAGGVYWLEQLSPDRRYALVKLAKPILTKTEMSGWANTYYLVDVSNGRTRIFLTDEVERNTNGSLSDVWWIRGAQ